MIEGPKEGDVTVAGGEIQWVLGNTGTVAWPQNTTLRLVSGPALMEPVVLLPPLAPGQAAYVTLKVCETDSEVLIYYAMVLSDGRPFGDILPLKIVPKEVIKPICICVKSPLDDDAPIEALQGELKVITWTLANLGKVPWPQDMKAKLFFNTPGLEHLSDEIEIPSAEPGVTVEVTSQIVIPEEAGNFKAFWAVISEEEPECGDILGVEFEVDEFPFMEWVFAMENKMEEASDVSTITTEIIDNPHKVEVTFQQHLVPDDGDVDYDETDEFEYSDDVVYLGRVKKVSENKHWLFIMRLKNTGATAWPENPRLENIYGKDLGVANLDIQGCVQPGEEIQLAMEFTAPSEACETGWVMRCGDDCFGPCMVMQYE